MTNSGPQLSEILEIAQLNLALPLLGLRPDEVNRQVTEAINPISWIVGHCAAHQDRVFSRWFAVDRLIPAPLSDVFSTGVAKREIVAQLPLPFRAIVDAYESICARSLTLLRDADGDRLSRPVDPATSFREDLMTSVTCVSLHYMGHAGQIYTLRALLGNPARTAFVSGVGHRDRTTAWSKWRSWWSDHGKEFA